MRIYVGNLQFDFTDEELSRIFSEHGQVASASIARDRETQRSKGFAFVEMLSNGEALAAITALNGKEIQQRALTVNEARPREERSFGNTGNTSSYGGGNRASSNRPNNRVNEPRTDKKGPAKRAKRIRR
ncbi:MAG: RNA-binding protein [Chloroflexi bacterium]|nr:RNA-binding protein [Chloroflexota bacterium]